MEDVYCVIDLKSFYASCECVARGLDPFLSPLVVCDPDRSNSTIVMSSTPYLKSRYNIPNVCRRRDLPKVDGLILATPRMSYYIEMSSKIVELFLDYVAYEDIHVYSIDESFLHIGPYLKLANKTPEEFVRDIQIRIKKEFGLTATAGIGPNMLLAKLCLDLEGKKKYPYIGRWHQEDVQNKLWKVQPITKVWGISTGIERRLYKLGIRDIEGLAKAKIELLTSEFGIMGEQLHNMANGIDETNIRKKYIQKTENLTLGQTLMRNYSLDEARLIIREMNDDLCFRLRSKRKKATCVSLYIGYEDSFGYGFSRQSSLLLPSDENDYLYDALMGIFDRFALNGPIRRISISFSGLKDYQYSQLSIFSDGKEEKKHSINKTLDRIINTFGKNAVVRATALTKASTILERHMQIGGHKA